MRTTLNRLGLCAGHQGPIHGLAPAGPPCLFYSVSGDGKLVLWDRRSTDRGELVADALRPIYALLVDPVAQRVYLGTDAGGLHVIDLVEREEIRLLKAHERGIFSIVALDGQRLACTSADGTLSIWRTPEMRLERQIPLSAQKLRMAAVDAGRKRMAIACLDGTVHVLDTENWAPIGIIDAHERGAASAAWHPSKPVLLTGGRDGHLRTWHAEEDHRPLQAIPAHRANIYGISFSPSGSVLATASRDKTTMLWDSASLEPISRLDLKHGGHTHSVNAVFWPEEGTLITAGDDRRILIWGARQEA